MPDSTKEYRQLMYGDFSWIGTSKICSLIDKQLDSLEKIESSGRELCQEVSEQISTERTELETSSAVEDLDEGEVTKEFQQLHNINSHACSTPSEPIDSYRFNLKNLKELLCGEE